MENRRLLEEEEESDFYKKLDNNHEVGVSDQDNLCLLNKMETLCLQHDPTNQVLLDKMFENLKCLHQSYQNVNTEKYGCEEMSSMLMQQNLIQAFNNGNSKSKLSPRKRVI